MPDSLWVEALMREAEKKKTETAKEFKSIDDEELAKIAEQLQVNIKVIGCGGGGSNTVNRCAEVGILGAQLCALNTDAKHLLTVHANRKILIGRSVTKGGGAGAKPDVGETAIRENENDVRQFLANSDVVFVTAGLGGGTGTGSAHVVAKLAKETGALVMGVVTMPFTAEGSMRMEAAKLGLEKLIPNCDTVIVIPNDKLLELVPRLPIQKAFLVADEILMEAIKGITEIVTKPGLVNLDFSDIKTVMKDGGMALIGLGESEAATNRVDEAVEEALNSPLLGEIDLSTAKGALVRVVGGPDLTISEAERASEIINSMVSPTARLIWGCSIEPELEHRVKVLLIITGIRAQSVIDLAISGGYKPKAERPTPFKPVKEPKPPVRREEEHEFDIIR